MVLLDSSQLKLRDKKTCEKLKITSFELMTKAANVLSKEILKIVQDKQMPIHIFCGNGNNGGDGMMVAKFLRVEQTSIFVYECETSSKASLDYEIAEQDAKSVSNISFHKIKTEKDIPTKLKGIVIDALIGSGLNKPVDGILETLIQAINQYGLPIISIDLPTGMPVDDKVKGECVCSNILLTIENKKEAFFFEENQAFLNQIVEVKIGLINDTDLIAKRFYLDDLFIEAILSKYKRKKYSHKGSYGHLLLVVGSKGMGGAAILSGKGALRSGCGLVTLLVDEEINDLIQSNCPEAMTKNQLIEPFDKYSCIAIGPGIGTDKIATDKVQNILTSKSQLVLDADAINIIAVNKWIAKIPKNSVLTPHPKEFDRLFGNHSSGIERITTQIKESVEKGLFIVLKTAHTTISTPDGKLYYNKTGNPGMAKGGSGDILTGMIASSICFIGNIEDSILSSVYIHGKAGDYARDKFGEHSMKSSDLLDFIKF